MKIQLNIFLLLTIYLLFMLNPVTADETVWNEKESDNAKELLNLTEGTDGSPSVYYENKVETSEEIKAEELIVTTEEGPNVVEEPVTTAEEIKTDETIGTSEEVKIETTKELILRSEEVASAKEEPVTIKEAVTEELKTEIIGKGSNAERDVEAIEKPKVEESKPVENTPRVNIERIDPDRVPYIAVLVTKDGSCSASILDNNWLMTAGSCVWHNYEEDMEVLFGVTDIEDEGKIQIKVKSIFIHPNYVHGRLRNDIALVRIMPPVGYTDQIQPIVIEQEIWSHTDPVKCTAAGYNDGISLKVIATAARGKDKCLCLSERRFLCTAETVLNSRCINDLGGPLICNNKLVGIRTGSFKKADCDKNGEYGAESEEEDEFGDEDNQAERRGRNNFRSARKHVRKSLPRIAGSDLSAMQRNVTNKPIIPGSLFVNTTINDVNARNIPNNLRFATRKKHRARISPRKASSGECLSKDSLVMYTYIHNYIDWIEEVFESTPTELVSDDIAKNIIDKIMEVIPRSKALKTRKYSSKFLLLPLLLMTCFLL